MASTATLPDAALRRPPARSSAREHGLLIGGERGRRRTAARSRRSTRPPAQAIATVPLGRRGRRRRRGARRARGVRRRRDVAPAWRRRPRPAHRRARRADRARRRRARRSSSRSTTASRSSSRAPSTSPARSRHLHYFAGWPTKIEGSTLPVSIPEHVRLHAAASRSACAGRSSRGTSRC